MFGLASGLSLYKKLTPYCLARPNFMNGCLLTTEKLNKMLPPGNGCVLTQLAVPHGGGSNTPLAGYPVMTSIPSKRE